MIQSESIIDVILKFEIMHDFKILNGYFDKSLINISIIPGVSNMSATLTSYHTFQDYNAIMSHQ